MANIRIHELAKKLGLASKEVLAKAQELEFSVTTTSSSLNETQTEAVRAAFMPDPAPTPPPPPPPPPPAPPRTEAEEAAAAAAAVRAFEAEQASRARAKKVVQPGRGAVELLTISSDISVQEFAQAVRHPVGEIIRRLLSMGFMAAAAAPMPMESVEKLGEQLGYLVEVEQAQEEEVEQVAVRARRVFHDDPDDLVPRPPVVTVMGHVDHGKTTLLDAIRSSNVAAGEAGGITQHIGAYQVETGGARLTFIDTPGHEAFTAMRARGAEVTDIVVLVVAADDGVMPQTAEAISHAQAAGAPMIVAINKMDAEGADPVRARAMLTEHGVVVEELGGDVVSVEMSALNGEGVDGLLEMIDLHAQVAELQANPGAPASGAVIESRLDKGMGAVATVIVGRGTLRRGDSVVAGPVSGRVRLMIDDKGARVEEAPPSAPVLVSGWSGVPAAGELFETAADDRTARARAAEQVADDRARELVVPTARQRLGRLLEQLRTEKKAELNLVVKADADGSAGAIRDAVGKLEIAGGRVTVLHAAAGGITENDVRLADAADAVVVGFNVRPDGNARRAAEGAGVEIRTYPIIYELLDDLKRLMTGRIAPEEVEQVLGTAEVRAVFRVPRLGPVAGCYVTEGTIARDGAVRLLRGGVVVYDGKVASLKRFKDDVPEVSYGYECGIGLDRFRDVKEGDVIEAYRMDEVAVT